jgi:hypothetical protein
MFVHPEVLRALAEGKIEDMRRERARRPPVASPPRVQDSVQHDPTIALRLCRVGDDPALARLAALEERPAPLGRFVVAEIDGRIVAALPLDGGPPLRDPFVRTAHLLRLLELRAAQLTCRERTWRGFRPWGFGLLRNSTHA